MAVKATPLEQTLKVYQIKKPKAAAIMMVYVTKETSTVYSHTSPFDTKPWNGKDWYDCWWHYYEKGYEVSDKGNYVSGTTYPIK